MQVMMRGRVRSVSDKMGRTLILLGKAEEVQPKKRAYKRRDMTAETIVTEPEIVAPAEPAEEPADESPE